MRIFTFLSLLAIFSTIAALSSCNTIEGMGEDIQKGGQAIQDAAE